MSATDSPNSPAPLIVGFDENGEPTVDPLLAPPDFAADARIQRVMDDAGISPRPKILVDGIEPSGRLSDQFGGLPSPWSASQAEAREIDL